jgi:hypothetical protein
MEWDRIQNGIRFAQPKHYVMQVELELDDIRQRELSLGE